MSARYASTTTVTPEKSRAELEAVLRRYGAHSFGYATERDRAAVMFEADGRRVRFIITLPDPKDEAFTVDPRYTWKARTETAARNAWEQAVRQTWRALVLVTKAKLEAVAAGISTFEEEFLAHIVLPGGLTVMETVKPGIEHAYATGTLPALMPGTRP